ncbi:hypothetical protein [Roseiconus lacunae]|nr:hypothetical protein [Roseiconus lacunae]
MLPFTIDYSSPYFTDGTDWTKNFPTGWTLDNSGNTYNNDTMPGEFDGWSLMDVASWIGHADVQAGRDRCFFGSTDRNIALVADPDEADDGGNADLGSPENPLYNSYISRTYDVSGRDLASLMVDFDFDFVCEDTQTGVVDISFDGGTTWQNLLTIDSTVDSGAISTELGDQGSFVAGVDFTSDLAATQVVLRFGCINASNDWWFCVDNIGLADQNSVIAFEDFEDTTDMQAFDAVNAGPTEPFDPSDGTDYTKDIPNWVIYNDGTPDLPLKKMYYTSQEDAFQGWSAVDALSWFDQQGDQQRGFFNFPARNTILLCDGDAHEDNLVGDEDAPPEGEKQFNSFIERTFDMSGYDNTTLQIEFMWESRLYASQRAVAQVSFDYGTTWTTILDVDSDRLNLDGDGLPEDAAYEATLYDFLFNDNNGNGYVDADGEDVVNTFVGPQQFVFGNASSALPASKSNTLKLRFGCLDTGNDWWFAVDDVRVSADTQTYVMGDSTGDGNVDFSDIDGFANALFGAAPYDARFDFKADGVINFDDIDGFAAELFN